MMDCVSTQTTTSPRTSAGRKFLGTTDDLFVRNDVPLVEEARDPFLENMAVHDELTEDETEEHKFGSKELKVLQEVNREES